MTSARIALPASRARVGVGAFATLALLAGCGTPLANAPAPARPLGPAPVIALPDTHQEADAMRVSTLDAQRVDRATFGVDATTLQQVGRLGYARWVDEQLHPKPVALPAAVDERIAQMKISREPLAARLREDVAAKKSADATADDEQKKAAQQAYQKQLNLRPTRPRSAGCCWPRTRPTRFGNAWCGSG